MQAITYKAGTGHLFEAVGEANALDYLKRPAITSPEASAEIVVPLLDGLDREACIALYLDNKHRAISHEVVSIGAAANTFMAPREVYRGALLCGAVALVVAHNHPSGDPSPSEDDKAVARRLAAAGEMLGVQLLDSLVVGGMAWVSLARRGDL